MHEKFIIVSEKLTFNISGKFTKTTHVKSEASALRIFNTSAECVTRNIHTPLGCALTGQYYPVTAHTGMDIPMTSLMVQHKTKHSYSGFSPTKLFNWALRERAGIGKCEVFYYLDNFSLIYAYFSAPAHHHIHLHQNHH